MQANQANRQDPGSSLSNPAVVVLQSMAAIQAHLSDLQNQVTVLRSSSPPNSLAVKELIRLEKSRQTPDDATFLMASALGRVNSFKGLLPMAPLDADTVAVSVWLVHALMENPLIPVEVISQSLQEMDKPTDDQLHSAASFLPVMYPNLEAARKDLFVLAKNQLQHIMGLESEAHKGTLSSLLEFVHQCEEREVGSPRVRIANDEDITSSKIGEKFLSLFFFPFFNLASNFFPSTVSFCVFFCNRRTTAYQDAACLGHVFEVGRRCAL